MIKLPDFNRKFEFENSFYLTCDNQRFYKPVCQYELYKKIVKIPGVFAEFGIFKAASFIRFLVYRNILEGEDKRKFVGFDVFDKFPEATLAKDKEMLKKYLDNAGNDSISKEQLLTVLKHKGLDLNIELVEGDIIKTLPEFIGNNPEIRFAFIHLDVDLYEPSKIVLEHCWNRLKKGGILALDDYGVWDGETRAVDEFFAGKKIDLKRFPFTATPVFIIKDENETIV